jgi:hypothetical protein
MVCPEIKILTQAREHDFIAMLASDPSVWETGRNEYEAIGKLVVTASERGVLKMLNFTIERI